MTRTLSLTAPLFTLAATGIADDKLPTIPTDAFLSAYRPALERLERRYENVTCRAVHQRPSPPPYVASVQYFVRKASFQSIQTYSSDSAKRPAAYPRIHVRSESPEANFELSCNAPNDSYFISGIGVANTEILKRYHRRYNMPIALAATHVFDTTMNALTTSKDAKINNVWASADLDADTVIVDFQLNPEAFTFHRARVLLQPSQDYQVRSYELFYSPDPSKKTDPTIYSGDIDYRRDPKHRFDVPRHVQIALKNPKQPSIVVEDAEIEGYEFNSVAMGQFQADHFGISETAVLNAVEPPGGRPTQVRGEIIVGQEVDVLIPILPEGTPFRVEGAESAIVCSRFGCGKLVNLPLTTSSTEKSNVVYRFKGQSPGVATLKLALITNCPTRLRIPVEISINVKQRPGSE